MGSTQYGRKTRSPAEREQHLSRVSDGIADGKTVRQQAEELDRTPSAISTDRRILRMRWAEQNAENITAEKFDQLEKLNRIEEEAWAAWDRSIGETVKQTRRITQQHGERVQTVSEETSTLAGDPRYLEQINKAVQRRCQILGLNAPAEAPIHATSVNIQAQIDLGVQDASRWLEGHSTGGSLQASAVAGKE